MASRGKFLQHFRGSAVAQHWRRHSCKIEAVLEVAQTERHMTVREAVRCEARKVVPHDEPVLVDDTEPHSVVALRVFVKVTGSREESLQLAGGILLLQAARERR